MIHEFRVYDFAPGSANRYLEFFGRTGFPVITRHLPSLAYWVTDTGELNQLIHVWVYQNMADRATRRAALMADPVWLQEVLPVGLSMIQRQTSLLCEPVRLPAAVTALDQASLCNRPAWPSGEPVLRNDFAWWGMAKLGLQVRQATEGAFLWRVVSGPDTGSAIFLTAPGPADSLRQEDAAYAQVVRMAGLSRI
jgi:NIPSNAP